MKTFLEAGNALNRTESEIRSSWLSCEPPLVSVVCCTYNHGSYLAQAINSFLSQQTNFPFEIIVHDDASTDNSSSLIREYVSAYPNIVRAILQTENQYSKGGFKPTIYAAGFSNARYIALCEGDDFWLSPYKLQTQVEKMEHTPTADFCFHSAYIYRNFDSWQKLSWQFGSDRVIRLPELMRYNSGSFAPTSSYLFRRELLDRLPAWFCPRAPVGDFFMEKYGALRGGALYIDQPMSVYRELGSGSWSFRLERDPEYLRQHVEIMLECLTLMESDFGEYAYLLKIHGAKLLLRCAVRDLYAGDEIHFKSYLLASARRYKFVSLKHSMVYYLRHSPALIRFLLRVTGTGRSRV